MSAKSLNLRLQQYQKSSADYNLQNKYYREANRIFQSVPDILLLGQCFSDIVVFKDNLDSLLRCKCLPPVPHIFANLVKTENLLKVTL